MRIRWFILAAVMVGGISWFGFFSSIGSETPAARFESKDTLLRPEGYREWVFVGSSLGLQYDPEANSLPAQTEQLYHNVYIDPVAYRTFSKTGQFPEGTMMVLELATTAVKNEPELQGSFQKEFVALEASVKDTKRLGGWAYFSFSAGEGKLRDKATPFPKERCWSCHHEKADTDHVFTQFYPVLRAVQKKP